MTAPTVHDMARIARSKPSRARRSDVYHWMHANFDQFSAYLDRPHSTWDAIAGALVAVGIKDRSGTKLTAANARLTWLKVRRAIARERGEPVRLRRSPVRPIAAVSAEGNREPISPPTKNAEIQAMEDWLAGRRGAP